MDEPAETRDSPATPPNKTGNASSMRDWLQSHSWLIVAAYAIGVSARRSYEARWGISIDQQSSLLSLDPVLFGVLCLSLFASAVWSAIWIAIVLVGFRPRHAESLTGFEVAEALVKAFVPSAAIAIFGPMLLTTSLRDGLFLLSLPYAVSVLGAAILFVMALKVEVSAPTRLAQTSQAITREFAGVSDQLRARFDVAKLAAFPAFFAGLLLYPVISPSWGGGAETAGMIEVDASPDSDAASALRRYPPIVSKLVPKWDELPRINCSGHSLVYVGSIVERSNEVTVLAGIPSEDGAWNRSTPRPFVLIPNSRIVRVVVPDASALPSDVRRAAQLDSSCARTVTSKRPTEAAQTIQRPAPPVDSSVRAAVKTKPK